MKRLMLGIAFFLVSFAVVRGADITYNLVNYPADQAGYTLSGYITTDGTIGAITISDVQSWSYTIAQQGSTLATGSSPSGDLAFYGVIATPTQLLLPLTVGENPGSEINLFENTSDVVWVNDSDGGPNANIPYYLASYNNALGPAWSTQNPQMGGTEPWVIAQTAAVPEPSTLTLLFASGVALLVYRWRKNYRR